jgi:secondary thiamine-phosphate synthase enzyme
MGSILRKIKVKTTAHSQMVDITQEIEDILWREKIASGTCMVYVPHTTAAVTINENADSDVVRDFTKEMDKIVPWDDNYRHAEGNSAAHIKASMMGFSELLIIEKGKLLLGTWQGVYFLEYDGPRTRTVYIKIMKDSEWD